MTLDFVERLECPIDSRRSRRGNSARKLVLLVPSILSRLSGRMFTDSGEEGARDRGELFARMQALRGRVYMKDGAITPQELRGGRHQVATDLWSSHLLIVDNDERVLGCARYTAHSNQTGFSELGVAHSSLATCPEWGNKLRAAVESELDLSRKRQVDYVEFGGWALDESIRNTSEALRMALALYGLSQQMGGVVGLSTATTRHCSSSILRRIGGLSLEDEGTQLPSYFDPKYNCEMEVLRFHSWAPNPRYRSWIEEIKRELSEMLVFNFGDAEAACVN